jgi:hypothetical protein
VPNVRQHFPDRDRRSIDRQCPAVMESALRKRLWDAAVQSFAK